MLLYLSGRVARPQRLQPVYCEEESALDCTVYHHRKDSPLLEVHLGANNHTRDIHYATKVYDLVVHDLYHVEGFARCDRVYKDISVNSNGMFSTQQGVLILGGVKSV